MDDQLQHLNAWQAKVRGTVFRSILAIFFAMTTFWSVPAYADMWSEWQRVTTDQGCIANIFYVNDASEVGKDWRVFHWTGTCRAGAPITGTGALEVHTMYYDEPGVDVMFGTMVGGYFQGDVKSGFYAVDAQGNWSSNSPEYALETNKYVKGCYSNEGGCEDSRGDIAPARLYKHALFHDTKAMPSVAPRKLSDVVNEAPPPIPRWAGQYHPVYKDYPINDAIPAADFVNAKTVEGCMYHEVIGLYTDADYQKAMTRSNATTHWSGKCEAGKPITGFGTLRSDNMVSGIKIADEKTGEMKNGYWDGAVTSVNLSNNKSETILYRGGCYIWKNDDGTPYMPEKYCRPVDLTH